MNVLKKNKIVILLATLIVLGILIFIFYRRLMYFFDARRLKKISLEPQSVLKESAVFDILKKYKYWELTELDKYYKKGTEESIAVLIENTLSTKRFNELDAILKQNETK